MSVLENSYDYVLEQRISKTPSDHMSRDLYVYKSVSHYAWCSGSHGLVGSSFLSIGYFLEQLAFTFHPCVTVLRPY